jgi:tetratricopeptide (TPR) repeat protein
MSLSTRGKIAIVGAAIGLVGAGWTPLAQARTIAFEDSSARALIQRVVELTFTMKYEAGLAAADSLEDITSGHPIVSLLRAGVFYCRMLDYEDMLDIEIFQEHYDEAWRKSEELKKSGESAEGNLYFGVLLGFKALLHQRRGEWWPAVKQGLKAVGYLKDCLKEDPYYSDAYLGWGTYKYWRSRAMDFINWLPLIPDEKDKGIEMVRQAMAEGLFGREISRSTLAWILIDHSRPSEAILLSQEGLKLYPGSRFYLWTLADGYKNTGQWRRAVGAYQELYDSIHRESRNNYYNELGICKQMARCHQALKNPEKALEWVKRGLELPLQGETKARRQKDLERLQQLSLELEKQVQQRQGKTTN